MDWTSLIGGLIGVGLFAGMAALLALVVTGLQQKPRPLASAPDSRLECPLLGKAVRVSLGLFAVFVVDLVQRMMFSEMSHGLAFATSCGLGVIYLLLTNTAKKRRAGTAPPPASRPAQIEPRPVTPVTPVPTSQPSGLGPIHRQYSLQLLRVAVTGVVERRRLVIVVIAALAVCAVLVAVAWAFRYEPIRLGVVWDRWGHRMCTVDWAGKLNCNE
jgi:hypothetical protein